ncbi:MAG: VOC family protein [Planctomycetaceae bacterium]
MLVQPYLYFNGRAADAINFYKDALGAEQIFLMTFGESPDQTSIPPGGEDKIMHASLRIGSTEVYVSDGMCDESKAGRFEGMALSLIVNTAEEAERIFSALSDGGQVQMPLAQTFFSPRFGMAADRFGVSWLVLVRSEDEPS